MNSANGLLSILILQFSQSLSLLKVEKYTSLTYNTESNLWKPEHAHAGVRTE